MKPLDRKSTSYGRRRGRARTLLRGRLAWLEGVPDKTCDLAKANPQSLYWYPLNQGAEHPQSILVDGQLLSRSQRCVKTLLADHRPALAREVGDIDAWQQRQRNALKLVRELADGKRPATSNPLLFGNHFDVRSQSLTKKLQEQRPKLAPVLTAIGWYWLPSTESPYPALELLENRAPEFERIAKAHARLAFRSVLLLLRNEADADGLMRVIASDALRYRQPRPYELHTLKRQVKKQKLPADKIKLKSDGGISSALTLSWWLVRQDDRALKQAMRLLNRLEMQPVIEEWLVWHRQLQAFIERTERISKMPSWSDDKDLAASLAETAEELVGSMPVRCDLQAIFLAIQIIVADSKAAAALLRVLEAWQQQSIPLTSKTAWLPAVMDLVEDNPKAMRDWLSQLARLSKNATGPALAAWTELQKAHYWNMPDRRVLENCVGAKRQQRLCDQLLASEALKCAPNTAVELELLVGLMPVSSDSQLLARFAAFQRAECADEYHNHQHLKLADQLERAAAPESATEVAPGIAGNTPEFAADDVKKRADEFVSNVQLCKAFTEQNEWVDGLNELVQLWANLLPRALVTELLRGSAPAVLKQCARELHFLQLDKQPITQQLRQPLPLCAESKQPRWVTEYPIELQPLLGQLAALDPNAPKAAGKLLAKDLPRANDIRAEITAIKKRIELTQAAADSALCKRLTALEQRLETPIPVSARRLQRLQQKLAHLVLNRRIDQFAADVHRQFLPRWARFFGFENANALPDWLVDPKNVRNLLYIRQLRSPSRKLGLRIVQRRCYPSTSKPWDFRDAEVNQRFLRDLQQQGLDTQPWVDGIGSVAYTANEGNEAKLKEVRLSLSDDPLQVLRMGAHFHTCLSPGGMNFFSVMANIADINKRVVYAHVGDGKIVGRVLLALTDQGGLLSFHRYHHHGDWGFENMVTDFCRKLTKAMGGVVLDEGDVSCLLAHDWYDDGSEGLATQFRALKSNSAFRQSLENATAAEFLRDARRAFDDIGLTDLTIPQLVMLPELRSNPALAMPAVTLLSQCQYPQLEVIDSVLRMAKKAEKGEQAWQQLREAMLDNCQRWIRRRKWLSNQYTNTVVDYEPATALKLLRMSRESDVRSWDDETTERRKLVAKVLRKLGRPKQAEALVRGLD